MNTRRFVGHYSGTDSHHSGPVLQHTCDRYLHLQGQAPQQALQALRQPKPVFRNLSARHRGLALQAPLHRQGEAVFHGELSRGFAESRMSAEGRAPQVSGPVHRPERLSQGPEAVEAAAGREQLRGGRGMARGARARLVHGSRSAAFGPDALGLASPRSSKALEADGTKRTFARGVSNEVGSRNLVLDPRPVSDSLCQVASHRPAAVVPARS